MKNAIAPTAGRLGRLRRRTTGRLSRGQSLVELALVLPIILLLLLIAIDFGRVYLGYINVQNMARIAANYAANHPTAAWGSATDPDVLTFRNQIINDARATNCALPTDATEYSPVFADEGGNGTSSDVGDSVTVGITCSFRILTPVISGIVGTNGDLPVSGAAEFPVKSGLIATGGGITSAPTAAFIGTPLNGPAPLVVQFTDQSTGGPTSYAWDFDGDTVVDSTLPDPSWTFPNPGNWTVTLAVSNGAGSDTETRNNYVVVGLPVADVSFTAEPSSGTSPLVVQFTDTSTNTPTAWEWDFNNDGTPDSDIQNPTFTYTGVGTYSVRLTVTNAGGDASTLVADLITVTIGSCTVPNFAGVSSSSAQALWQGANFTTTVQFQQGNLPWVISSQSQVVGQQIPCNSPITVSKN